MENFVIVTDSSCDLDTATRKKYDIDYLYMYINYDGKELPASLDWDYYTPKQLYDNIRNGARIRTAQITVFAYLEAFEKYLQEGKDVLSITCSSALSASVKASFIAREQLKEKYPDRKIICIDALRGCMGQGMLAIKAAEMRNEGKTIDETGAWIEENKSKVHQIGTVEDLVYLRRAGRVTAASAVFGGLLQIKPIIIADAKGQNLSVEKVRGRRASLNRLVEMIKEEIVNPAEQIVYLNHADCIEDANMLKERILKETGCKDVYINWIGPIIGASCGPGMIGIYYMGNPVTVNA